MRMFSSYNFFNLYANVQLVKHDCRHYAKRDSRLPASGGVMLQRVCIAKKVNRHFSLNYSTFCNKNN